MSDDLRVLFAPAAAYRVLVDRKETGSWLRPAWFAFFLGCVVSLATSGRLTLRLVVPAALYAALIPFVEIPVLRLLLRGRGRIPPDRAVDLFFMGHTVWCVWLLAVAAIFAFADPIRAFVWTGPPWGWVTLAMVVIWSAYTDLCFFRCVSPGRAEITLLAQRTICWGVGLAIFGGGSLWTGLLGILGR